MLVWQYFKSEVSLSHFSGCHSGSTQTSIKTDSGWFVGCKWEHLWMRAGWFGSSMCCRSVGSWPCERCNWSTGAAMWKRQIGAGFAVAWNWEFCGVRNAYNFYSVVQGSKPPIVSPWALSFSWAPSPLALTCGRMSKCFRLLKVSVILNEGSDTWPGWSPSGRTKEAAMKERCWRRRDHSTYVHESFGLNPSVVLVFISHSINLSCVSGNCLFALGSYSYISVNIF